MELMYKKVIYCNFRRVIQNGFQCVQVLQSSTKASPEKGKNDVHWKGNRDVIGPPDSVSNLRPIRFHIPVNESPIEKQYRFKREEVQQWSQEFWKKHNSSFIKEKETFVKGITQNQGQSEGDKKPISADEMSVFYKAFLDKNWMFHVNYNKEWYTRNVQLLWLSLKVLLYKTRTKLFS